MRYILDNDGYIMNISFGNEIECDLGTCTLYTGEIPTDYETIEEWLDEEIDKLNAWKIVDGNLVYDENKYKELQAQYAQEEVDNSCVTHKELYGLQIEAIQNYSDSPYTQASANGKIITFNNGKKVYPKIKLTNIDGYSFSKVDLIVTKKNMLPNEALSMNINGLDFTQNEDRSITINGASTAETEYTISGSSANTSPFLCLKKNQNYVLSSNNHQIKMYNYDGTDRTEIYSGTGGVINFTDEDKLVTHITLVIPTGTEIEETIYPQLELGTEVTDYEMYEVNNLSIDFSEYVEEGLFPSNDLFPGDDLFPAGTTIDYLLIDKGKIYLMLNSELKEIATNNISIFDENNTIYTLQDTDVDITYCINNLALEGTITKNQGFHIDGKGTLFCEGAEINKATINKATLNNVNIKSFTDVGDNSITISSGNTYEKEVENTITDNSIRIWNLNEDSPGMELIPEIELYCAMGTTRMTALGCESPLFDQTSLAETKKNFELFDKGLDIIKETDIYKYNLKSQIDDTKKHIGVVIGEGYKTPKEILSESERAVDLYSMISVTWKAIQEQQEIIETLIKKIEELEGDK